MRTLALLLGFSVFLLAPALFAKGSSRPFYGGGRHTTSHGGTFRGAGPGSSHKGGKYRNPRTADRYGQHKVKAGRP
jgi:hypothetical protein